MPKRLAITAGEPAGIGPDLCVMIAQQPWPVPIVAIGDPQVIRQRAAALKLPLKVIECASAMPDSPAAAGELYVLAEPLQAEVVAGRLDPTNAGHVLNLLLRAISGCQDGTFAAMVTAPIHKGVINDAGIPFTGHTEFLAEHTSGHPVMLLTCPGLRVALVTTHLALREVADAITPERLERVIRILHAELQTRFSIDAPHILVCGLNPHAGENGYLGHEEREVIEPVLDRLRQEGMNLEGPLPADTLFNAARLENADAVLAMYHDQGLPVLKHKGFGRAVNITLGLPIVRTSVDHGTALDLAATGMIDPGSMIAAVEQAIAMTSAAGADSAG